MKIALGSDHAGYRLKEAVREHLATLGHEGCDFGTDSEDSVDYPDDVFPAARSVATGECELGIVFGGSGNGEAMVANKVRGVRCGVCWDLWSAQMTKAHNNANVIALGGRVVSIELALQIVETWLKTSYEGGRHEGRLLKMAAGESGH